MDDDDLLALARGERELQRFDEGFIGWVLDEPAVEARVAVWDLAGFELRGQVEQSDREVLEDIPGDILAVAGDLREREVCGLVDGYFELALHRVAVLNDHGGAERAA